MTVGFRAIVGFIALAVFIGLMVLLYYAAANRGKHAKFPPDVPQCPDFFVSNPNGTGCLLPPGLGNRDMILDLIAAKDSALASKLRSGGVLQIPSGSLCHWTQQHGISWNGVSNVHPCIDA